jgi:glycosyltransferase involved in cell wall biosynthesis
MRDKFAQVIGMEVDEFDFLPNPVDLRPGVVRKSARAQVVFLGRLDSVKRPWLFAELARRFPAVEFQFAGQANDRGEGTWEPDMLPPNVRLLGHIDGPDKVRALSSAWVLVNTSIHEGLPISFLEALACETPILACVDPGGLTSEFGLYIGHFDGTGLDALPDLVRGLERLLADAGLRTRLGKAGRRWVEATHSPARFRESFWALCARAGILGDRAHHRPV